MLSIDVSLCPPGFGFIEKLYESASKAVFRAFRLEDRFRVVVKVLRHPSIDAIARMDRECAFLTQLQQTGNVPRLLPDRGTLRTAIIMKDEGGIVGDTFIETHSACLQQDNAFLLHWCYQLAYALMLMHSLRVMHNDIKPRNILFHPDARIVQLLDFDLACVFADSLPSTSPRGTLHYMAPEQTGRLGACADYRADLYSLGVVFYQLSTGVLPFKQHLLPAEIMHATINEVPKAVSLLNERIPLALSNLIAKLLSKSPYQRYQSGYGVCCDLKGITTQIERSGPLDETFLLAQEDKPLLYRPPTAIYGREHECAELLATYERVRSGALGRALVLLSGPAGVGKSAIMSVLQQRISNDCLFASGKYELNTEHVPYAGIVQAFTALMHLLPLLSAPERALLRTAALNAVGAAGGVITELATELEKLLGKQPVPLALPLREAQNRFETVFTQFIFALAKASNRPLVLFLDDVQWADRPSLRWLELIMSTPHCRSLFVVAAYRDNEAKPQLLEAIETIQRQDPAIVSNIYVTPLSESAILQLLQQSFGMNDNRAGALARILREKTLGNPFFLCRYLKVLCDNDVLRFDYSVGSWVFDAAAVSRAMSAENVGTLMAGAITELGEMRRQLLQVGACVGNVFSVSILVAVTAHSEELVRSELQAAMRAGMLLQLSDDEFKFCHDHLHHACYNSLSLAEQQRTHLKLGMHLLLAANTARELSSATLFATVGHLNFAIPLLRHSTERVNLIRLNIQAAINSKRAAALDTARSYTHIAISLLEALEPNSELRWQRFHALTREAYLENAQCYVLLGDFAAAAEVYALILNNGTTTLDERIDVLTQQMGLAFHRTRHLEACELGAQVLSLLGEGIESLAPSEEDVLAALLQAEQALERRDVAQLAALDEASDLRIAKCYAEMTAPAYFADSRLCAVVCVRGLLRAFTRGLCGEASVCIAFLALELAGRGRCEAAFKLGQLACSVADRFQQPLYQGKAYLMFASHVNWFKRPFADDLQYQLASLKFSLDSYDHVYASFTSVHIPWTCFLMGSHLLSVTAETRKYRDLIRDRLRFKEMQDVNDGFLIHLACLQEGNTIAVSPPSYYQRAAVQAYENALLSRATTISCCWYLSIKCITLYMLGQYEDVIATAKLNKQKFAPALKGHPKLAMADAHLALSLLQLYKNATAQDRSQIEENVRSIITQLRSWALMSPHNLGALPIIVEAEFLYVVKADMSAAMKSFNEALVQTRSNGTPYWHALAAYRMGAYLEEGAVSTAAEYVLHEAHTVFLRWGADTLSCLLARRYPVVLRVHSSAFAPSSLSSATSIQSELQCSSSPLSASSSSSIISSFKSASVTLNPLLAATLNSQIDFNSMLQVARALSEEIVLDSLLAKVLSVLQENASANRVYLCIEADGELSILAQSRDSAMSITTMAPQALSTLDAHAFAVICSVREQCEPLLLDDINADLRFRRFGRTSTSVLCLPILRQSRLLGVLYLENSIMCGAFAVPRVQLLQAMLPQVAISIENAQLVQRLTAMSDELRKRNEALLQEDLRKDQFLAITTHELRTPLHGIIGASSLLADGTTTMLTSEQRDALDVIQGSSRSLLLLVNDILDLTRIHSSRLPIQHCEFQLTAIADAALELVAGVASEKHLEVGYVIRPPLREDVRLICDPVRLQQIITNLLANAVKFTERGSVMAIFERSMEVEQLSTGGSSEPAEQHFMLRCIVRDTGIGIPPEKIGKLFALFSQVDTSDDRRRFGGYGVGLYLCQQLLDLLGGSISAESDGCTGTTFRIRIPVRLANSSVPSFPSLLRRPPTRLHVLLASLSIPDRECLEAIVTTLDGVESISLVPPVSLEQTLRDTPVNLLVIDSDAIDQVTPLQSLLVSKECPVLVVSYVRAWRSATRPTNFHPLFKPVLHEKCRAALVNLLQLSITKTLPPSGLQNAEVPTAQLKRLLIVEDNVVNSRLLVSFLKQAYQCDIAMNGSEAVGKADRNPYDLILMDIQMPIMDGLEATRIIRLKEQHRIPIIAVTASFSDTDKALCLEAGMDDLLPKPFTKQAVLEAVQRNLARAAQQKHPIDL